MAVSSPPHIGFCLIDGHAIFLDTRADRYWLAPPSACRALHAVIAREPLTAADDVALAGLHRSGLIDAVGDTRLEACTAPLPETSLLDDGGHVRPTAIMQAWRDTMLATWALRHRGLARTIASLAQARVSHGGGRRAAVPDAIAAGYVGLRLWLSPAGRCLPLSLALATRCADPEVKLVIGVKLDPFAAHAWVQRRHQVLNDHVETVRPFTPVFVA